MIPILPIIGLLSGIGSAVGNAIAAQRAKEASARETARAQAAIDRAQGVADATHNEATRAYTRDYYTPVLSRIDSADLLNRYRQAAERARRQDAAREVISGGAPEVAAARTAARATGAANTVGQIGLIGQRAKDVATARKQQADNSYSYQTGGLSRTTANMATDLARSHATAANNALKGIVSAVGTMAGALTNLGGMFPATKSAPAPALSTVPGSTPQLPSVPGALDAVKGEVPKVNDLLSAAW